MKRFVLSCLTFLLLVTLCAGESQAQSVHKSGIYAGLRLGPAFVFADDTRIGARGRDYSLSGPDDEGGVLALGVLAGYDMFHAYALPLRLELEYMPRSEFGYSRRAGSTSVQADIEVSTLFVNMYYDFRETSLRARGLTPYVNLGLGQAFHDTDVHVSGAFATYGGGDESSDLAWNIGAGLGLAVSPRVVLDLGVRYASYGTAEYNRGGNSVSTDLRASEFLLGARYEF